MGAYGRRQSGTLAAVLFAVLLWMAGLAGAVAEAAETSFPAQADFQRLEGRWVRPDGGYVLELRDIGKDGSVAATYFNPRPVRVFKAQAAGKDGALTLFVELRDVNYPGSTYRLKYDAASDRLKGTYFQAVQRQTFEVEFVRVKQR